jgi:hypothetical protein
MTKRWLLAALLAATPAAAHDWYPMECCHGMDCAAVEKVEIVPTQTVANVAGLPSSGLAAMAVTTKHGTVIVPANFPRRESKDNRMHACMRPAPLTADGAPGGMRLICIFMPPAM